MKINEFNAEISKIRNTEKVSKTALDICDFLEKIVADYPIGTTLPVKIAQKVLRKINISAMDPRGKLEGKQALGTSCKCNRFCKARAESGDEECVCTHCYAEEQLENPYYLSADIRGRLNYLILNSWELIPEAWNVISDKKLWDPMPRLEWSGDVGSVLQCANYINLALAKPNKTFVPWSKNLNFWNQALHAKGLPENIVFVASSPMLNKPMYIPDEYKWFVHHRFTVYTPDYLAEHAEITINCGGHKCKPCGLCYSRDTEFDINEKLK